MTQLCLDLKQGLIFANGKNKNKKPKNKKKQKQINKKQKKTHCVKSAGIRSYFGPYFTASRLNNSEYGHFLRSELTIIYFIISYLGHTAKP